MELQQSQSQFISPDDIRIQFSRAMSEMYKKEVPAYGTLIEIVERVNKETIEKNPTLRKKLEEVGNYARISEERHGAIRLGTAQELATVKDIFAVMGMKPVSYYDLSIAGVPVHSTAFRPVTDESLRINPFRVFTSLLRLDQIKDSNLREEVTQVLNDRDIFSNELRSLLKLYKTQKGFTKDQADRFIRSAVKVFAFPEKTSVTKALYEKVKTTVHPVAANILLGPMINHLTPSTLNIDRVQELMPEYNINPKAVIEGPAGSDALILLRQTSFKAIEAPITFADEKGSDKSRFGEVEQRGIALKPKGRELYDKTLAAVNKQIQPDPEGKNAKQYVEILNKEFKAFSPLYEYLRQGELAYFEYYPSEAGLKAKELGILPKNSTLKELVKNGYITYASIIYEDFLPISAAGIFKSNIDNSKAQEQLLPQSDQQAFQKALGRKVLDSFELYQQKETASINKTFEQLGITEKKTLAATRPVIKRQDSFSSLETKKSEKQPVEKKTFLRRTQSANSLNLMIHQ